MNTATTKDTKAAVPAPDPIYDNEDLFFMELLRAYTFWKGEVAKLTRAGKDAAREKSYVEAYRLLLHNFTRGALVEATNE